MSSLLRTSFLRASLATHPAPRAFSLSARRSALSESDHSHDAEDRKAKIDSHKDAQLKDKQWKKELASNSEAALNADKSSKNISEMQKETAAAAEKEKGKK